MKPASPALVALLQSQQFVMADLYTFTLQGSADVIGLPPPAPGPSYLYSGAATAITDQTTGRFFALGPRFERSMTKTVIGIQSDELDIRIYPATTDMLGEIAWAAAVWQGQLDGATLQLERAFMPAYGDTAAGTVVLFSGRVSDAEVSRTMISLKVRSWLEVLNIEMPRRLWQASCSHNFGDEMCGYNRVAGQNAIGTATGIGALTFAAAAGSTASLIQGAPIAGEGGVPSNYPFNLGTLIAVTGVNAGQARSIGSANSATGALSLTLGFLSNPNAGDEFQVLPGCDRTLFTCGGLFLNTRVTPTGYNAANAERFGGMPFVPPPEQAV
jgi:hypothetical protein